MASKRQIIARLRFALKYVYKVPDEILDMIDFEHMVDETLSYHENLEILLNEYPELQRYVGRPTKSEIEEKERWVNDRVSELLALVSAVDYILNTEDEKHWWVIDLIKEYGIDPWRFGEELYARGVISKEDLDRAKTLRVSSYEDNLVVQVGEMVIEFPAEEEELRERLRKIAEIPRYRPIEKPPEVREFKGEERKGISPEEARKRAMDFLRGYLKSKYKLSDTDIEGVIDVIEPFLDTLLSAYKTVSDEDMREITSRLKAMADEYVATKLTISRAEEIKNELIEAARKRYATNPFIEQVLSMLEEDVSRFAKAVARGTMSLEDAKKRFLSIVSAELPMGLAIPPTMPPRRPAEERKVYKTAREIIERKPPEEKPRRRTGGVSETPREIEVDPLKFLRSHWDEILESPHGMYDVWEREIGVYLTTRWFNSFIRYLLEALRTRHPKPRSVAEWLITWSPYAEAIWTVILSNGVQTFELRNVLQRFWSSYKEEIQKRTHMDFDEFYRKFIEYLYSKPL